MLTKDIVTFFYSVRPQTVLYEMFEIKSGFIERDK